MAPRQTHAHGSRRSKQNDPSYYGRGVSKKAIAKPDKKAKTCIAKLIKQDSAQPKLSALERLPTEILQEIFLLSPNLNLPLASPFLGKKLASDYLKTELVIQAFSSPLQLLNSPVILSPIVRTHFSYVAGYSAECIQSASFCRTLLNQKWLTYDFFKRCQKIHLLRVAEQQLRTLGKGSSDVEITTASAILRRSFERYTSIGGFNLSKGNEARHGKAGLLPGDGSFVWKRPASIFIAFALLSNGSTLRIDMIKGGQWPSSVCRNVDSDKLYKDYGSMWYNTRECQEACSLTQFPGKLSACHIPEKLLHGPWLQEKGDFLTLLLTNRARMPSSIHSTMAEVASKGLEDAIRESNVLAVSCLLGVGSCAASGVCHHRPDDECSRTLLEKEGYKVIMEDEGTFREDGSSNINIPKPPDPRGPWKRLNCPNIALPHIAIVKPTTEHLRIALIEMDACNEFIVKALMGHFTHHPKIDYRDDDIMQWAFANLNRPSPPQMKPSLVYPTWEKPLSGAMLMDLLDEAQSQQSAREKKNKRRREDMAERRADWAERRVDWDSWSYDY